MTLLFTNGYPDPERTIPPPPKGYERQWLQCRRCQTVMSYDFVPFSMSRPILSTTCGHDMGLRDLGCNAISEEKAMEVLSRG